MSDYQFNFQPITHTLYHDWMFQGLNFDEGFVSLEIGHSDLKATIECRGVVFLLARDILKCNIINYISMLEITPENLDFVKNDMLNFNSEFFSAVEAERFVNLDGVSKYLMVTSTYGIRLGAICSEVIELR